ncbi:SGNH/GDSL hydrolase family protein [Nocardioides nitrophenolicus]|uniref:SGNH/GDSL hydrolase family protein n=1 Tax=Nocardioides nitrophenolicus TaxID=60489 RepID=UPI00195EDA12|nr:SGNH/GDSL hydrolase family protein [Nocardioides nitrophenolicus]MBM7516579.1 lysophospholipase L1-like esterase [Nocardioides nitrophenolicus]
MRHRLRVLRAHVLAWIGILRLARALSRGQVDQVWVGESNAAFFAGDRFPPLGVGSTIERRWAWHLGPRLMYSIARDGFKPSMHRAARLLARAARGRDVVWVFSFGEIDIRCHLAPRVMAGGDVDFVTAYADRVRGLLRDLGLDRGVVMVPVPPATQQFVHESFPVRGTNEERLATHGILRERLVEELAGSAPSPRLLLLDATDELSDADGWFRAELHTDGVHPNDAGREVAQAALRRLLERTP